MEEEVEDIKKEVNTKEEEEEEEEEVIEVIKK